MNGGDSRVIEAIDSDTGNGEVMGDVDFHTLTVRPLPNGFWQQSVKSAAGRAQFLATDDKHRMAKRQNDLPTP